MKKTYFLTALLLVGCIRPQNYHPTTSTFAIQFPDQKVGRVQYFAKALAYESYIEFDARGQLFDPSQVDRAAALIQTLKHTAAGVDQPVTMFLFVHGWKNNASEDSGNVWGFRRILDEQAASQSTPVIGVYIGWPGDAAKFGKLLTFFNRESVADTVGGGDLDGVLSKLLVAVKGAGYQTPGVVPSTAILIGHSFGGLVLERALIRIIEQQLAKYQANENIPAPADLMLLLNEAGPASQARPLLLDLIKDKVEYVDASGKPSPLIVAMTSDGDAATKLAFPASEFISGNRPKTVNFPQLDVFGQSDTLPYNLLSPANMVALRSHQIVQTSDLSHCDVSATIHKLGYCVERIPAAANTTPYWIMALPQIFVPDHSSVFRREMIELIDAFAKQQQASATRMRAMAAAPSAPKTMMLRKKAP
jgi:hypothetical protein